MSDLFAGIPVSDRTVAVAWYEQLFGFPPAFYPNDLEAVWELADHRFVFIEVAPEHAGHARLLAFVDDLDAVVSRLAGQGIEPVARESYEGGVRTVTYRDPDGNRYQFGGAPV